MPAVIPSNSFMNFMDFLSYEGVEFFDTPDLPAIPTSKNDVIIQLPRNYLGRLDLMAYDYYGDESLWWIIALANNIEVIPSQMKLNQNILIPALDTVRKYISQVKK